MVFSRLGSPIEALALAMTRRVCAGLSPGLSSASRAHSGSVWITVEGLLASPMA